MRRRTEANVWVFVAEVGCGACIGGEYAGLKPGANIPLDGWLARGELAWDALKARRYIY